MGLGIAVFFSTLAAFVSATDYEINHACDCVRFAQCQDAQSNFEEFQRSFDSSISFLEYLKKLNCSLLGNSPKLHCYTQKNGDYKNITCLKPKQGKLVPECGRGLRHVYPGALRGFSDYPWLALLEYDTLNGKKILCGGVLVSEQYVLTSAVCGIPGEPLGNLTSVLLGEFDTITRRDCLPRWNGLICKHTPVKVDVDRVILHDDYFEGIAFPDTHRIHDIALVKLKEKVMFSEDIDTICLPESPPKEQTYFVAGWGRSADAGAKVLNRMEVSTVTQVDRENCKSGHPGNWFVTEEEHICAGNSRDRNERVCVADAGGPLIGYEKKSDGSIRPTIFGVTTVNFPCIAGQRWGERVFTQLHKYTPWIHKHIYNH